MSGLGLRVNWKATATALVTALVLAIAMLALASPEPAAALRAFFISPLSQTYALGNMLNVASLLILTALGVTFAFQGGTFNLGGEGQLYASALVTTVVLLRAPELAGGLGILVACVVGGATGALIAGVSGILKAIWETDELITSFLLSSGLIPIVDYLIVGPLRDRGSNLLATPEIAEQFHLPKLLPPSHLNATAIIALLAAAILFAVLYFTLAGYELRMNGLNRHFARYGGVHVGAYTTSAMAISGAFHGLAGALLVIGTYQMSISGFSGGLGWNGIAVALIGRTHPLGVIPGALIFAYLDAGARSAMYETAFTFELGMVVQAVIFFLITAQISRSAFRLKGAAP
ncbi:MAG: ABC transporter permease [Alkalispirochaetaceae bacterium]